MTHRPWRRPRQQVLALRAGHRHLPGRCAGIRRRTCGRTPRSPVAEVSHPINAQSTHGDYMTRTGSPAAAFREGTHTRIMASLGARGGGDEARGHEVYQLALGDLDVAGLPVFRLGRVHGHPADGRVLTFVAHELVLDLQGPLPEAELLINPDAERLVGGDHVGEEEGRHPDELLVHGP